MTNVERPNTILQKLYIASVLGVPQNLDGAKKIVTVPIGQTRPTPDNNGIEISKPQKKELTKEQKKEIARRFRKELAKTKKQQGLIGKAWNWFKNTTTLGLGSDKIDKLITKFENGEVSAQEVQEKLKEFNDGQNMCVDVFADIVSGVAAVGIYTAAVAAAPFSGGASIAVGVAAAAGSSALIKTGIKSSEAYFAGKDYSWKDAGMDAATGSVNGLLAPITGGIGGAVGKTAGKVLGVKAVQEGSKLAAKEALTVGTKTGFKAGIMRGLFNPTGYKYVGGTGLRRFGTFTIECGVDGALGGSLDNMFRASINGENIFEAGWNGLIGGALLSPVIGGGFKLAGKGANRILGKKADNAGAEIAEQAAKNADASSDVVPPNIYTSRLNVPLTNRGRIKSLNELAEKYNERFGSEYFNPDKDEISKIEYKRYVALFNSKRPSFSDDLIKDKMKKLVKLKDEQWNRIMPLLSNAQIVYHNMENICKLDDKQYSRFLEILEIKTADNKYLYWYDVPDILKNIKSEDGYELYRQRVENDTFTAVSFVQKKFPELLSEYEINGNKYKFSDEQLKEIYSTRNPLFNNKEKFTKLLSIKGMTTEDILRLSKDEKIQANILSVFDDVDVIELGITKTDLEQILDLYDLNKKARCSSEPDRRAIDGLNTFLKSITAEEYAIFRDRDLFDQFKHLTDSEYTYGQTFADMYDDPNKTSLYGEERIIAEIKQYIDLSPEHFASAQEFKRLYKENNQWICNPLILKFTTLEPKKQAFLKQLIPYISENADNIFILADYYNEKNIARINQILPKIKQLKNFKSYFGCQDLKSYFGCQDLKTFLDYDTDTFEKMRKFIYIPERGNKQFDYFDREKIKNLPQEQIEKITRNGLWSNANRGEQQLGLEDIIKISELDEVPLKRIINKLMYIEGRGENQFSGDDLVKFAQLNEEQFNQIKDLLYIKNLHSQLTVDELLVQFKCTEEFLSAKTFKEKSMLLKTINTFYERIDDPKIQEKLNLDETRNRLLKAMDNATEAIPVATESKRAFFKDAIKIKNEDAQIIAEKLEPLFANYGKTGLPLKFSREDFIKQLNEKLKLVTPEQKADILKKLDIKLTDDGQGYNGLLQFKNLDATNEIEKSIRDLVENFMLKNELTAEFSSANPEVAQMFNSLIKGMPEFVNIIGKKHHGTHQYTIDMHTIKVLQEALSHPKFKTLSSQDKQALQLSIILHDLAKNEAQVDTGHEFLSALYANNILKKFNMGISLKDRISEMVKFHNWFEGVNSNNIKPEHVAVMFRNPEDLTIAEIFAKSDLMGVSKEFHDLYIRGLDEKVALARKALEKFYQSGNMLFTTRVLNLDKLPVVKHSDGNTYRVINFNDIPDNADLRDYGLSVQHKKDFRILNHCGDFEVMKALTNPANEAFICTTLISPDKKATYDGRRVGLMLEADNTNVINAWPVNQGSGYGRNFDNFVDFTLGNNPMHRTNQRDIFLNSEAMKKYNLSVEEYGLLYKELLAKKYLTPQIVEKEIDGVIKRQILYPIKDITINGKTISRDDIIAGYKAVEDDIMQNTQLQHNEINVYNPKIKGVILIGDDLSELPENALKFARENNLPIFIMGSRK